MHLLRLSCKSSEFPDISAFSRLAGHPPQRLNQGTYFYVNPEAAFFIRLSAMDVDRDGVFFDTVVSVA